MWFDGIRALLINEGGTALTAAGADTIAKLQSLVSLAATADEVEAAQADFKVYIGEDTMRKLKLELYNKNMYAPGTTEEVPGTGIKIQVAPGLTGVATSNVILMRTSNVVVGLDGEQTFDKVNARLSPDGEYVWMDIHAALGVQVKYPAKAFYGTV